MENRILGLHHITAIANNAQRNFNFYTHVLGCGLVKKTVNFDDPSTYHLYYGNEEGTPGTIITFFPWEGIEPGKKGVGMATEIGYSVPTDSLNKWADRLRGFGVSMGDQADRFGERYLPFADPDGLSISFIAPKTTDDRPAWETADVKQDIATQDSIVSRSACKR
jgi:glyoxalase family protein